MTCCTVCGIGSLLAMRLGVVPPPALRGTMLAITAANAVSCRLFMVALSRIPLSLTQTVRAEGPRGLYRGIIPNMLKAVPAMAISYSVFETSKKLLLEREAASRAAVRK